MKMLNFRAFMSRRHINMVLLLTVCVLMALLIFQRNQCLVNIDKQERTADLEGQMHIEISETSIGSAEGLQHKPMAKSLQNNDDTHRFSSFSVGRPTLNSHHNKSETELQMEAVRTFILSTKSDTYKGKITKFSLEGLMENITTVAQSGSLFYEIEKEKYLLENESYFAQSRLVNNHLMHSYLITGENICKGDSPYLLLITPSVKSHSDRRNTMRRTWMKAAEEMSWPGVSIKDKVKHVFMFGYHGASTEEDRRDLVVESMIFGDIVMADFVDSYRNLTRKMLVSFQWVLQYCEGAKYVQKVDEDTLINIPLMLELLHNVTATIKAEPFVLGLKHGYSKPAVMRKGRWAVSEDEYALPYYPHYMYGHTYVISKVGVRDLVLLSNYVKLVAPEDAFITGILPKTARMLRLSAPSFTVCCRPIYDCEVVWNKRIALTAIDTTTQLDKLWTSIVSHTCNNTVPFSGAKYLKKRKT